MYEDKLIECYVSLVGEYFSHMEASPLSVKAAKFKCMLDAYGI